MWGLPPPDPGIEIVIASRGISKGLAQTEGAQVLAKPSLQFGPVQLGGQWKNISSPVADGEAAAFINYAPKLGAVQLTFGAAYKWQTNVKGNPDDDSMEFASSVSRKFGKVGLKASAVYTPDDFGKTRRSLYIEGGPSFDIDGTMRVSANLGRRSRVGNPDYTSFNGGISKTVVGKITLDARYYDTAESDLGEVYRSRLVVSARLNL
jgi:hypothetical protein